MAVDPSAYSIEYKPASSWIALPAGALQAITVRTPASGGDHPLLFGDDARAEASFTVRGNAITDQLRDTPFRIKFSRASVEAFAHVGGLYDLTRNLGTVQIKTKGFADRIARTKAFSPAFYRRPIATKTSGASIEDPSNISYRAGLINYLFWQAGGRPAAQDSLYPSAPFYYRCDQALDRPEWSWTAGDNAYQACQELAQAIGGQIYQAEDGVVVYRNPLSFAGASSSFSIGAGGYGGDMSYVWVAPGVADSYLCQYMGRAARPVQEVYNEQPGDTIAVGETRTFDLDLRLPIAQLETAPSSPNTLKTDALNIAFFDGSLVPLSMSGGYLHTVAITAQRVTLTITNYATRPFKIHRITLRGTPIAATEGGSARYGSGMAKSIPQSVFIQSRAQAERIVRWYGVYLGQPRKVFSFTAPFDPAKKVGDRGTLSVSEWGLSSLPVVIIDRDLQEDGRLCKYRMVDATGIPVASEYFLVGSSNYAGQTRKVGL